MSNRSQQVVLVTGASAGVGAAAVAEFARRGWRVVATGRSPEKLASVVRRVRDDTGVEVESHVADFARLADVRHLAAAVRERYERIDVLANNAGMHARGRVVTEDGHELTWQANHLAPFLLTRLLDDRLGAGSRVVTTASVAHRYGRLDLADPSFENRRWVSWLAYCASKLANVVFTRELARRLADRGAVATCFHPGAVRSDFGRNSLAMRSTLWMPFVYVSSHRAAGYLLRLAVGNEGTRVPGAYYAKDRLRRPSIRPDDPDLGARLWQRSLAQTAG